MHNIFFSNRLSLISLFTTAAISIIGFSQSHAQTLVPGSVPAEFTVNSGAASYSIPIKVASGRGGMQPELSLNYSSNGGNGILGVGWSVGGLSAISRCGRTFAQDAVAGGINFDSNDRYCLDGQRLVPVRGANGGIETEYRTEVDGYAKITSYGGSANNPNHWIVRTKAGQVMTYGGSGNANWGIPQGNMSWSLRKVTDTTAKNTIFYHYFAHGNLRYLGSISYPGGKLNFQYANRPDTITQYVMGQTLTSNRRLTKIITRAYEDEILNEYRFTYKNTGFNKITRLSELFLCGFNNHCTKPLKFTWQAEGAAEMNTANWTVPSQWGDSRWTFTGDFNGDGRTDIASATGPNVYMKLATTAGGFRAENWTVPAQWCGSEYVRTGDFNGDGLTDIACPYAASVRMKLSTGSGFTSESWPVPAQWGGAGYTWTGDFNGDGRTDIASASGGNIYMKLSTGNGFTSANWTVPSHWGGAAYTWANDFNGDGLTDIASASAGNIYMKLSTGTGFKAATWTVPSQWGDSRWTFAADFNGDGLTDIASATGPNVYMKLSTGKGFKTANWTVPSEWCHSGYVRVEDFNSDGRADIACPYAASVRMKLSTGKGFDTQTWSVPSQWGGAAYTWAGDFNGDGVADIASASAGNIYMKFSQNRTNVAVSSIVDTAGNKTQLSYKPLTSPKVYTKGSGETYPMRDIQYAQYVVSRVRSNTGLGDTTNIVDYTYHGLKTHARGRGVLGFRRITAAYPDTKKEERSYFKFGAYPMLGVLEKVEERYKDRLINTKEQRYVHRKNGRVFELFMDRSIEKSYELSGSTAPVTTVTTWNQRYDGFGNPGRVVVETKSGDEAFRKYTDSVYTNNTAKWHLGRLTRSITTHRSPGQPDQKRQVQFIYNAEGLLSEEKIVSVAYPSHWLMRTNYSYNAYGQKTRITESAPGQDSRVTTQVYDRFQRLSKTCNTYNECSTHTYNAKSRLAKKTGPNGLATRWQHDSLGRVIREDRADGTWTTKKRHFANSSHCSPHNARLAEGAYMCVVTQSKGSPASVVQYDTLGRKIRAVKKGFDGRLVYSDTGYDRFGRVKRVSRDYYDGDYVYWATSEYDVLDRVVRATQPGPHGHVTEITTRYMGLTTTVYSGPDSKTRKKRINALGKTVRVDESLNTYVEYAYTSDGSLKTTRASGNNATLITLKYDEFGRKIESNDPDMGRSTYQYNGFDELTRQQDAKGQVVTMVYDRLGHLIRRDEPEGRSSWVYGRNNGSSPAPQGSIGKLLRENAPGITKDFSYDNLGRPDSVTTTIAGQGSFTVENSYDGNGRLRRTTYPGNSGFFTENIYNGNGYLAVIRGLRRHAEVHDYAALKPLISKANSVARDYLAKARKLRDIGRYYQQQITYYQSLTKKDGQRFVTAEPGLMNHLNTHKGVLNKTVNQGTQLNPTFLGHLNQAIDELQTVSRMIDSRYINYQTIAEQLTTLAAQTLAAADHNFSYYRGQARVASYYNNNNLFNEDTNTIEYWRAADVDASGRISAEVYGNGIVNDYTYNQGNGQLEAINSSVLTIDSLRHLEYEYDAYDNVTLRHDLVNDIRETYDYDGLDRLKAAHVSSDLYDIAAFNHTQSLNYNKLGNITYKSDVGDYSYGNSGGPHAVTRAGNKTYRYDANGNMTQGAGRSFLWSSYNKATRITQSGRSVSFKYGADRARFQKTNHKGDITLYVGQLYEETRRANGVNEKRHTIFAGGAPIAEHIISSKEGTQTRYLHKDALGSIDLITDAHANVVDRRSFDAWGKMRDLPWRYQASLDDPLYLTQLPYTNKGYTGHEQVQEVDLIHMNGRMYDATLARFISADPNIQSPEMSQNYNRYSYVMNNPMKYTDPSGFFFKKLFRAIKKVVKKIVNTVKQFAGIIVGGLITTFCQVCGIGIIKASIAGFAAGAVGAAVNGGNILRAGLIGAFSGGVFGAIGASGLSSAGRVIAHGIAGGTLSVLQGGKFGAGFLSAGFAKFASIKLIAAGVYNMANRSFGAILGRTTVSAVVGGTASVIGGGKFANGARTAAFAHLFNAETQYTLRGRMAHARFQRWRASLPDGADWEFEKPVYRFGNASGTGNLDAFHRPTGQFYEIKPNNPDAVYLGMEQIADYAASNPGYVPGSALMGIPTPGNTLVINNNVDPNGFIFDIVYYAEPHLPGLIVYNFIERGHVAAMLLAPLTRLLPGPRKVPGSSGSPVPIPVPVH